MRNANARSTDPRVPPRSDATDFKNLSPGQYARHPGRSSEREAMAAGSGIPVFPEVGKGFQGRDVRKAAVAQAKQRRA